MNWLLFLSQLPATPSSLRVNVWRKLRAAGALGLQNGVWMLPDQPEHEKFLDNLLHSIQTQGAAGQVFHVTSLSDAVEQDLEARSRADREEEYSEFFERTAEFLAEIEKESAKQKFTFAELEENEQDFQRLAGWLKKINQRDFFGAGGGLGVDKTLENCRTALETFTAEVYKRQMSNNPADV